MSNNTEDRAAIALVYYTTLADLSFDSFPDHGDIIVDGDVTTHTVLGAMLSALREGRAVCFAPASSGMTGGAAILAGAPPIELPLLSCKRERQSIAMSSNATAWPGGRIFLSAKRKNTTMTLELRKHMIDICRRMNAAGINQGTSGNLSVRLGRGFLITPTMLRYDLMEPDDIVDVDFDGGFSGHRQPSSEWRFHRDILRSRPDREAVLHCHSSFATSMSCHRMNIPAYHYMVGLAGGTDIRCAKYAAYGTQELSDNALEALDQRDACLLANHGQIALGRDLERSFRIAVEVETLARGYIQARAIGEPVLLTDEEMEQVLTQMKQMGYGQAPDLENVKDRAFRKTANA
jgi:L-fuculose-phosphate aldolase